MLSRVANTSPAEDRAHGLTWEDLGAGAPTIIALARLCGEAMANSIEPPEQLSAEAKTILYAARDRGVLEIKGSNNAFDSVDRFLSVVVELDADTVVLFKQKTDPGYTIRMLEGFRELCAAGLLIHHLFREFSLSRHGFDVAAKVCREDIDELLAKASELDRHEW